MSLSIITKSTNDFFAESKRINERKKSAFTISFDNESDTNCAKYALFIEKNYPYLLSMFSSFKKYDPTQPLPNEVREKAIRLCPKSIINEIESDISGVVSSIYKDSEHFGSMIWVIANNPLEHILRLYYLLQSQPKKMSVTYSDLNQRVTIEFDKPQYNFWFENNGKQIVISDLKESIDKGLFIGLAFAINERSFDMLNSDNFSTFTKLPDSFFEKQMLDDWIVFNVKNKAVVNQSAFLNNRSIKNNNDGEVKVSTWMTA